MYKKYFNLFLMLLVFILTAVAYFAFTRTTQFITFVSWTQSHLMTYFLFLVTVKIAGIIYPPIPGGILTLASIPMLGWQMAYIADLVGSIVGGTTCYFLGKRYGYQLLTKVFDDEIINKIEHLKVKKEKELEAIIVWRLLAGGTVIEAIYYGAGFLKVGLTNFFLGIVISHLLIGIPSFYIGSAILSSENIIANVIVFTVAIAILYKIRGRYFE